jgi:hypothetical protein
VFEVSFVPLTIPETVEDILLHLGFTRVVIASQSLLMSMSAVLSIY